MALDNIEHLLEKYDNAETTLAEEAAIRSYFEDNETPPHLESYKILFQYVSQTKKHQFTKEIPMPDKGANWFGWVSLAAVALVVLGLFFQVNQSQQQKTLDDLNHEQLMAYNQTMEVFNLVSEKLNKGTENLAAINLVATKLNEGAENLNHLNEFNKVTNRIIKQ